MNQWGLEVRFPDSVEKAVFGTRPEVLEYACSIIGDYDGSVEVAIFSPSGECELIQPAQAFAQAKVQ